MRQLFVLILWVLLTGPGCNSGKDNGNIRVEIETGEGDIVVELYPGKAPQSVKAFLEIVDKGYYNNSTFYRVLNNDNQPSNAPKADLVQGGLWSRTKKRPELPMVAHETTQQSGLHHLRGTVSFAREAPGTATSEFFICMEDQPGLDFGGTNNPDGQGYAAFGKVVKGMDVVNKIFRKPEFDQYFDPPVPIYSIERN